jgi:predicted tellurium resistance membrane protein TerC
MCIAFVVIFFIWMDKKKVIEGIAYFGLIFIINKNLDDIATAMDWYDYRMQLEPIIPTMLPANLFAIPVILTLIYQHNKHWKRFLVVLVLVTATLSYVGLPLMEKAEIYLTKAWNSHYSFISLLFMAVLSKALIQLCEKIQE